MMANSKVPSVCLETRRALFYENLRCKVSDI